MRIAVVGDIHGNRTAFAAVLADLREAAPDLIFHAGDLADGGAGPVEIVDQIRDLGWPGVVGNTDEMLFRPPALTEFAEQSPRFQPFLRAVQEMADSTRAVLGAERLAWMSELPRVQVHEAMALVHANPESVWRAPAVDAGDDELESVYGPLGKAVAVHGHIHHSYIRKVGRITVANTGSVSLSYDGDRRASYLLLDNGTPSIRRVEYDVERELKALVECGMPHADWVARILASGRPQMP
jgi:putative phosphoesterase